MQKELFVGKNIQHTKLHHNISPHHSEMTPILSGEFTNLQLWQIDNLRFTVKLVEAGEFVAAVPHTHVDRQAVSVNGGRTGELTGRRGSSTAQRKALVWVQWGQWRKAQNLGFR